MIHHYTNIGTLALILDTKKIRFTRYDFFDDLEESIISNDVDLEKQLFASCWTRAEESIPQWHMYGSQLQGVRISFPENLFNFYDVKGSKTFVLPNGENCGLQICESLYAPYTFDEIFGNGYILCPEVNMKNIFLRNIEYTENIEDYKKKYNSKIQIENGTTTILGTPSDYGIVKSKAWSFQEECRFVICARNGPQKSEDYDHSFKEFLMNKEHLKNTKVKNIDLLYNIDLLDKLVVTLGPCSTKVDELLVSSLLEKYAPSAKIIKSRFTDKVRVNFK